MTTPLFLKDPRLLQTRGYVNGSWIETANQFTVHDPATGEKIADVAGLGVKEFEAANDAA